MGGPPADLCAELADFKSPPNGMAEPGIEQQTSRSGVRRLIHGGMVAAFYCVAVFRQGKPRHVSRRTTDTTQMLALAIYACPGQRKD